MYDPVMSGSIFLQPGEPGHVNNAIYNKRNGMFIFQIEDLKLFHKNLISLKTYVLKSILV